MHVEGAGGLLHILPEYRRMGLGSALTCYGVNAMLDMGFRPFGQIETHNEASLALSRGMGMTISDDVCHWLFAPYTK